MTKKPTDKIADAIGDGEIVSDGGDAPSPAPLAKTKAKTTAKLNKNQRRRKNAASAKADGCIGKAGKKVEPKKQAVSAEDLKSLFDKDKGETFLDGDGDEKSTKKAAAAGSTDRIREAANERRQKRKNEAEARKVAQRAALDAAEDKIEAKKERQLQTQYNVTLPLIHGFGGGMFVDEDGDMHFWEADNFGLPIGCPVQPLGTFGDVCFYLSANGQIRELKARDHSRNNIAHLFGAYIPCLQMWWPQVKKATEKDHTDHEWLVTGWKSQVTADVLMAACDMKGIWNSVNKVRGLGAWDDDDGGLIYHCGNRLWSLDGAEKTGEYEGYIYPALTKLPAPWDKDVPAAESPAKDLLSLFKTWNWERPELDPVLLIGWLGASILSGALDWRPMVFVTGDAASGKSTIHKIIRYLFGDGIISTTDTTPAGIYQLIGQSCIPVAVDELENEHDNNRAGGIMKLARLASSGSLMLRGGADHKGTSFKLYNCFMFSAVLTPPLRDTDRSRLAMLSLKTLPEGARPPEIKGEIFEEYGRKIKRRMIYKWPFFKEVLQHYQSEMSEAGHDGRASDQFGTLIAAAHVMLSDDMPSTALTAKYMKLLAPEVLDEINSRESNADNCLNYLLQSNIGKWRSGSDKSISALLEMYLNPEILDKHEVRRGLGAVGMGITESAPEGGIGKIQYLAVAVKHKQTMELFGQSDWSGLASTEGGWAQALRRIPNAVAGKAVRIDGHVTKCVKVPLYYIYRNSNDDLEKLLGFEGEFFAEKKAQTSADRREDAGLDPFDV